VLDVAAGEGRHALFFAERGARVVAVDRDEAALRALPDVDGVDIVIADLEHGDWPLGAQRFDAIVVVNYLHRPLFPQLMTALADDGTLLYQTFARGNEQFGHPRRAAFLLDPDELLQLVAGKLCVVAYEQGYVTHAGREAVVQRIAAVGRSRQWPPALVTREE
jgi:SAM-dependent methyltransferase